jgi:hypothetical protein
VPGDDELFEKLIAEYLEPSPDPNRHMAGVEIVWVEDNPRLGALHMREEHGVEKHEVEEVLFEVPPQVEAKRTHEHPGRTYFWGATRRDRWLFVSCEDWKRGGVRYLKPITAFEPDRGIDYWRDL